MVKAIILDKIYPLLTLVLSDIEGIDDNIADVLELNVEALKTLAVPYSAWQDRTNQKLFNGKK